MATVASEMPEEYRPLTDVGLDVSQQDVAYLYRAYVQDRAIGTSNAANFADAILQHEIIDLMFETSEATFGERSKALL